MSEDGAERSHDATPQKLEEARKRGELVRSQDLATAASYLGLLGVVALVTPHVGRRMLDLGGTLLQDADRLGRPLGTGAAGPFGAVMAEGVTIGLLLIAPCAALVLAVLLAQRAIVVAPTKLAPKLSRISPLANAKQKFGPQGLFEFGKSAVKMGVFGGILAWCLMREADELAAAATLDPRVLATLIPGTLAGFLAPVAAVSLAIAALDYAWQRHSHLAKNRMTRQELLDESKRSEGDPHLKQRRRQKGQEIALNSMLRDVADSAVVLVNPTHYAVALKWSPTDPTPPVCVAKGVDHVALRIREAAREAGVPIHSDPPTARALWAQVDLGAPIDRAHFAAVAAAIRFARALEAEG